MVHYLKQLFPVGKCTVRIATHGVLLSHFQDISDDRTMCYLAFADLLCHQCRWLC